MELGKIPPHDLEAEQAVLGSMLTDKDAVIASIETLKPESFYREDNRLIYEAILNLYNNSEPIDIITLKAELESLGKFEQVGGLEYIASLPDKVPTTANVQKYINIVEEKGLLRNLIKTANEIIELGYDPTEDVEDIMDNAEKKIFNIMQNKNQKGYTPIKDVLVESFNQLEELYNRKQHITGVPTGFTELDYKTAGFHGSDLILVAARPAMGKSAFALNIATNAATKAKVPVVIFSLEMSKEQMVNRMLCSEAMVDSNKVRTGKLEEDDWVKLAETIGPLSEAEIYIDDTPGISVMEIRAKCRKLKLEKNIGMVVIDYLQLVQASNKRFGSREQEISEISRSLKVLAKELNVPVIALSQLSRAVEQRPDHRPMLSDLRESGAIEQDADIVMFLYRDDYYNEDSDKKDIAEVIISKHRAGSTGIGKTLEDLLGIVENNFDAPDFGVYELKSCRLESNSMLTIFTKTPQPKGAINTLLTKFGYSSSTYDNDKKVLHATLSAERFSPIDGTGHSLKISCNANKISIIDEHNNEYAYWTREQLKNAFEKKYKNKLIYAKAHSRNSNSDEEFKFIDAYELSGFNYTSFIKLLEQGKIYIDLRIGQYHSDKKKGQTHDHGTGFRIKEKDQDLLFLVKKKIA